ncbi:MAG: hypothetical protein H6717_02645 [Polyangiaceae bacterium]|nr:hypothetical protein [Polyangiaceae bacterium]
MRTSHYETPNNGSGVANETVPRKKRRRFTAAEKLRIVREATACALMVCVVPAGGCGSTSADPSKDGGAGGTHDGGVGVQCDDGAWRTIAPPSDAARSYHAARRFNDEVIVWGGLDARLGAGPKQRLSSGWRLNVLTGHVSPLALEGAPTQRKEYPAVALMGHSLYVWGNNLELTEAQGRRYDLDTDQWLEMSSQGEPSRREYMHAPQPRGMSWVIWGGDIATGPVANGARYDAETDSWQAIPDAPFVNSYAGDVSLSDGRTLSWGGQTDGNTIAAGVTLNAAATEWTTLPSGNAPPVLYSPLVEYAPLNNSLLVWGNEPLNDGRRFDIPSSSWQAMSTDGSPFAHSGAAAVAGVTADRERLVVFGGVSLEGKLSDGGIYDVTTDSWSALPSGACAPPGLQGASMTAVDTAEGSFIVIWGGVDDAKDPERGYILKLPE